MSLDREVYKHLRHCNVTKESDTFEDNGKECESLEIKRAEFDDDMSFSEWKPISALIKQYLNLEPVLFNEIEAKDINQGALGDCYFLSAIASLTETEYRLIGGSYNKLLRKIMALNTPELNAEGVYSFKLFIDGEFLEVKVNEMIPTFNDYFTYAHTANNEVYIPLMEKAWAKVNNTYRNIIAGTTEEAFRCLTGYPSVEYKTREDAPENWLPLLEFHELDRYDKLNFCMCTSTSGDTSIEKLGLVSGHAYTLIDVYDVEALLGADYKDLRLVKLRNPWGQGEWSGPWCDSDSRWDEQLVKLTAKEDINDGLFFMRYEDFCTHYSKVTICEILPAQYSYQHVPLKTNKVMLKVTLLKEQAMCFYLNSTSKRLINFYDQKYDYKYMKLVLYNDKYEVIDAQGGAQSQISFNMHKKATTCVDGVYYVSAEIEEGYDLTNLPFTFGVWGLEEDGTPQYALEDMHVDDAAYLTHLSKALKNLVQKEQADSKDAEFLKYFSINMHDLYYGAILIENKTDKLCEFKVELQLTGLDVAWASGTVNREDSVTRDELKEGTSSALNIVNQLEGNGDLLVLFEWVGTSVGTSIGYSWKWKEPLKDDNQIISELKEGTGQEIGGLVQVYNAFIGQAGYILYENSSTYNVSVDCSLTLSGMESASGNTKESFSLKPNGLRLISLHATAEESCTYSFDTVCNILAEGPEQVIAELKKGNSQELAPQIVVYNGYVGINGYVYYENGGHQSLEMDLTIELRNMHVQGVEGNLISFTLKPDENKLIEIVPTDKDQGTGYDLSQSYGLTD